MIRRLLRSLATALLCVAIPVAATAQTPDPGADERPATRIQIDLGEVLGQAREAFRAGDLERAIGLYQVVLTFAPDFRVARIELSLALAMLGERERAARLLRDLDTDGLEPEVLDLIGRIIGPDRLTFFLVPEFFMDTNVTGQTQDEIIFINGSPFRLSDEARGERGYGYGLTFGAGYRLTDEFPRTTVTGGVTLRDFAGATDDEQSLFASASFGFDFFDRRFALTPSVTGIYRYKDWEPLELEGGAGLAATVNLEPVRNTLGFRYRDVGDERDGSAVRDRKSYEIYDALAFGFEDVVLRFDERYIREDWEETNTQDNYQLISGIDATFVDLVSWAHPTIGTSFTFRNFKNPASFFNIERLDRRWEGHVEILFQDWELFGSNPFIRYEYSDQQSNISLFDFDKHEISVGIRAIVF